MTKQKKAIFNTSAPQQTSLKEYFNSNSINEFVILVRRFNFHSIGGKRKPVDAAKFKLTKPSKSTALTLILFAKL
jgi:hypothetical protein